MSNGKLLLGWDTATPSSGLVLMEGGRFLAGIQVRLERTTTGRVFAALEHLLEVANRQKDEVGALALVRGPGSFTGIRLAVAAAKGLALSLGLRLYSTTVTEALARLYSLEGHLLAPILDARRGQGYGAIFRWKNGELERLTPDMALDVERWRAMEGRVVFVGPGVEAFSLRGIHPTPSPAVGCALLAWERWSRGEEGEDPLMLEPLYIRPSDAEVNRGIRVSSWD